MSSHPGSTLRTATLRSASTTWRGSINSHEQFSHDSISSLGYDWSRIADPHQPPRPPFKAYLPRTTADIVAALAECRQLGQDLRVRSNGHSSNDLVVNEHGAVLLMQTMNQIVSVDEERLVARVQGGAVSALVDDALAERGLGLPVIGDHRDITVGGFLSVGGISPASHRFGLFVDNVLALEVVTWDGEVVECSRDENADLFYRVLCGLGRHGVVAEVSLRIIRIDKYRTIWENHQTHYSSMDAFIEGTQPIILDPGDAMMERGVWIDFPVGDRNIRIGQFSAYHETTQSRAHQAANASAYEVLHRIGQVAGRLPPKIDRGLKMVGIGGVIMSPRFASIKNIEFFTDKVLDSTVGDPTRMLIVLGPLDRFEQLFRDCWALLADFRARTGCFTFLSVYVKSIRSDYLARDGQDRFCELMFYLGCNPTALTPDRLDEIVEQFDDIVIANNAYRYMHSRTSKDPAKLSRVDPNLRHAERRAADLTRQQASGHPGVGVAGDDHRGEAP